MTDSGSGLNPGTTATGSRLRVSLEGSFREARELKSLGSDLGSEKNPKGHTHSFTRVWLLGGLDSPELWHSASEVSG